MECGMGEKMICCDEKKRETERREKRREAKAILHTTTNAIKRGVCLCGERGDLDRIRQNNRVENE